MHVSDRPRASRRRSPRRMAAAFLALVPVLLAVLTAVTALTSTRPALAHTGTSSYLYLDVTDTSLGGRIEAPIGDLSEALGIDVSGNDDEKTSALDRESEAIQAYLLDHFDIGAGDVVWPVQFSGAELFFSDLPEEDDNYVIFPFTVDVDGEVPRNLEVRFDPFFELEGRDALMLIGNDWQAGVIDNGHETIAAFDPGNRSQGIDLGDTGWLKTITASTKLGVEHIRTGPDHILFVLILVLPAVLVFTTRWEPVSSFGSALWRVLKIVTMFTVTHSITFTLAGLDILPLPSPRIVESVIALSIAAAALHNIRPVWPNKEWLISFVFGLFHGMGFASLVSGLDVDRSTQLVSLLGRNIGIEIGQAAVVVAIFPALYLLRRTHYYQGFFIIVSLLMALVSLGWMVERSLEIDLGVSSLVDPVVEWPRVLILIALLTLVAFGLYRLEAARNRLLPTADRRSAADDVPDRVAAGTG